MERCVVARGGVAVVPPLAGVLAVVAVLAGCGHASVTGGGAAGPTAATSAAAATAAATALKGPESGDVMVHGTVLGADGPAEVTVALWPSTDDTEIGEAVDILTLPAVTTDAAGHWAVEVDPDDLDEAHLPADNPYVNYDVNVVTRSQEALWGSTAFLVDGTVWRSGEQSAVADSVTTIDMDLEGPTVTLTDSEGMAERSELTLAPPRPSS